MAGLEAQVKKLEGGNMTLDESISAFEEAVKLVGEYGLAMDGDDVIFSKTPVCRQLMDVYEKYGNGDKYVEKYKKV